jgi:hypothetical protein
MSEPDSLYIANPKFDPTKEEDADTNPREILRPGKTGLTQEMSGLSIEGGRRRSQKKGGRKSKKCSWGGRKSKKQQKGGKRKSQKKGGKKQKKQQPGSTESARDQM